MLRRLLLSCLLATPALGADPMWTLLERVPDVDKAAAPWVRPARFQPAVLDENVLLQTLRAAPLEFTPQAAAGLWLTIPRPDGAWETFEIVESPVMEPGLAAQFPQIKTYRGQGLDDPSATIRLDHTPQGFHAQVLSPRGAYYIDPYSRANTTLYSVYFKRDHIAPQQWFCETPASEPIIVPAGGYGERNASPLRTYRLACAADGEYTTFQGGTVALGQAAVITAINRVTGVYETEMAVRMTLVASNSSIIYTNSGTDPYTNNNGGTMLGQNQTTCDGVIGSANYDIGHVFSTGGGGIAGLGVVCVTGNKARGVTGNPSPTGDSFWIDYVAHEMGHQFGANHTFNSSTSNCGGGNRSSSHAYEDGSGSTIMAYAGICGADDLQPHSDPYFAFDSLGAINSYITGGGACSVNTATGNNAPTVVAGAASTIPARTPFTLTAQGSDVNGDPITYCWEERDLGVSTTLAAGDNGTSPIIRSFNPTTSPSRTVPRLSTLLGGAAAPGEILPTTTRTLNWRVTVRDNRSAAGGFGTGDRAISVFNTGTPFAVTSPNTNVSWSGSQTVTWTVAGTTANGINCANVKISLSTDGGNTFPTVLLASTPNNGSAPITLPSTSSTQARVKVEAVGNIFFDISDVNFTITGTPPPPEPTNVGANPSTACDGGSVTLSGTVGAGQTIDWYTSSCGGTLVASGTSVAVTPGASTTYRARTRVLSSGQTSSGCTILFVPVSTSPAITQQPADAAAAPGQQATFHVAATGATLLYRWRKGGVNLNNGGSISGALTDTLTINPVQSGDAGDYDVVVSNACNTLPSSGATLTVGGACGSADFDCDGDLGTDADIEAFFACLAGACPAPPCSGSADFNGDGDLGTDADIEAFFRVLAGGTC
jgi:Metallo-peptidase family M12B Reprolysin-like/Immunoglobulin I-set domain/Ig-like domain CHU_C associated